jgi:hypothetical protein
MLNYPAFLHFGASLHGFGCLSAQPVEDLLYQLVLVQYLVVPGRHPGQVVCRGYGTLSSHPYVQPQLRLLQDTLERLQIACVHTIFA